MKQNATNVSGWPRYANTIFLKKKMNVNYFHHQFIDDGVVFFILLMKCPNLISFNKHAFVQFR